MPLMQDQACWSISKTKPPFWGFTFYAIDPWSLSELAKKGVKIKEQYFCRLILASKFEMHKTCGNNIELNVVCDEKISPSKVSQRKKVIQVSTYKELYKGSVSL